MKNSTNTKTAKMNSNNNAFNLKDILSSLIRTKVYAVIIGETGGFDLLTKDGVAINLENSTGPEDGITYKFEYYMVPIDFEPIDLDL